MLVLPLLFIISLLQISTTNGQPAPDFKCKSKSTCESLIGYKPTNPTTLSHIKTLFQLSNIQAVLGPNNLPPSTSASHVIPSNETIKIPIPCRCSNGSGLSDHVPVYTVVKDDGLFNIATLKYGGLVTYPQIQKANKIPDPNLIIVGQKLWVPLPCSCDDVDGTRVLHYAHVVAHGSSVAAIAAEFDTTSETLMSVNGISDPKKLIAGQVIDVPLKVCSTSVSNSSLDYPLLLASNSYAYTANDCVKCKCDSSTNMTLQCGPSGLKPTKWSTCPAAKCSNGLGLGDSTTISSCSRSMCAYTGYYNKNQTILTSVLQYNDTCSPPSSGGGAATGPSLAFTLSPNLAFTLSFIHLIMIFVTFL